jgi:peptidylprolyl isomerase
MEPETAMKLTVSILLLAASAALASAQTTAKPAATTAKKPATSAGAAKLPPGIPVVHGIVKPAFTLRYEDYKIGTGADAEPNKMYKVQYTGYLAADGHKFDSSYDHPRPPVMDKDGKPVMDPDGKPKQGDPQPLAFPQGMGRLIPGFDQGFYGMKVGGKRRLFIPWQLAYGVKGRPGPDAEHPGIPAKADLIFDIELVDQADLPTPPQRPGMPGGRPMPGGMRPGAPGAAPGQPGAPGQPLRPAAPGTAPAPGSAPATPAPGAPAPAAPAPSTPGQPAPQQTTPPPSTAPQPAPQPQSTTPNPQPK